MVEVLDRGLKQTIELKKLNTSFGFTQILDVLQQPSSVDTGFTRAWKNSPQRRSCYDENARWNTSSSKIGFLAPSKTLL